MLFLLLFKIINPKNNEKTTFFSVCVCMFVSGLAQAQKPLRDATSLAKKPILGSLEEALKNPLEAYKLILSNKEFILYYCFG